MADICEERDELRFAVKGFKCFEEIAAKVMHIPANRGPYCEENCWIGSLWNFLNPSW